MPDYSQMSNEQLLALGTPPSTTDYSKMSDSQLLSLNQGTKPTTAPQPVGALERIGKRVYQGALGLGNDFSALGEGVTRSAFGDAPADAIKNFRQNTFVAPSQEIDKQVGPSQSLVTGDDSIVNKFSKGTLTGHDIVNAGIDLAAPVVPLIAGMGVAGKIGALARGGALAGLSEEAAAMQLAKNQLAGSLVGSQGFVAGQMTGSIYDKQPEDQKDLLKAGVFGVAAGAAMGGATLHTLNRAGLGGMIAESMAPKVAPTLTEWTKKGALSIGEQAAGMGGANLLEQVGKRPGWDITDDIKHIDTGEAIEATAGGAAFGLSGHLAGAPKALLDNAIDGRNSRILAKVGLDDAPAIPKLNDGAAAVIDAQAKMEQEQAQNEATVEAQKQSQYASDLEQLKPLVGTDEALHPDSVAKLQEIATNAQDNEVRAEAKKTLDDVNQQTQDQELDQRKDQLKQVKQDQAEQDHVQKIADQQTDNQEQAIKDLQDKHASALDDAKKARDDHSQLLADIDAKKAEIASMTGKDEKGKPNADAHEKIAARRELDHLLLDKATSETNFVSKMGAYADVIANKVSTYKEFATHMLSQFGELAKKHLLGLWKKVSETRGSLSSALVDTHLQNLREQYKKAILTKNPELAAQLKSQADDYVAAQKQKAPGTMGDRRLEPEGEEEHLDRVQAHSERATEHFKAQPEDLHDLAPHTEVEPDSYDEQRPPNREPARDQQGNIIDRHDMSIVKEPHEQVASVNKLAVNLYYKNHPELKGKHDTDDTSKQAEIIAHKKGILVGERKTVDQVKQDIIKNPVFGSKPDAADFITGELKQALKEGYSIKSLLKFVFRGEETKSFADAKEIPQAFSDFMESLHNKPEASTDEQLSRADLDSIKKTLDKFGADVDIDKLLEKLDATDHVTMETFMYLMDESQQMTKPEIFKNIGFFKELIKQPESLITFIRDLPRDHDASDIRQDLIEKFGDKMKLVTDGVLDRLVEKIHEEGVVPERQTSDGKGSDALLQSRADTEYAKDATLRGATDGVAKTNIVASADGREDTPAARKQQIAIRQKKEIARVEHQFKFADDIAKFNKDNAENVAKFFDALDKIRWDKSDNELSVDRIAREMGIDAKAAEKMIQEMLRMTEVAIPGEEQLRSSKSKEWQNGEKVDTKEGSKDVTNYVASEFKDALHEKDQLGMASDEIHIDPVTGHQASVPALNVTDGVNKYSVGGVDFTSPNGKKILSKFMYQSHMQALHELALQSVPEAYSPTANKVKAMQNTLAYDVARAQKTNDGAKKKEIYNKIDKLKNAIAKQQATAAMFLMEKNFRQAAVMDKARFEQMAADVTGQLRGTGEPVTAAKLYDLYIHNGSDIARLESAKNKLIDDAWTNHVDDAYQKAKGSPEEATREILTSRLTATEKELYEQMRSGESIDAKDTATLPEDTTAAIATKIPVEFVVDPQTRYKLETIREAEDRILALAKETKKEEREKKPATLERVPSASEDARIKHTEVIATIMGDKATPEVITKPADQAATKPVEKYTDAERQIVAKYSGADLKVVSIRNPLVRTFFDKVAKMFDADLITVHGDTEFKGRYIPEQDASKQGTGGRATIVVNLQAGSMARIFAHELFHHVLNKVSPGAYETFRDAIKEVVDEGKWNEAVDRIGKQLYPLFNVQEFRKTSTNEVNSNGRLGYMSGGDLEKRSFDNHLPAGYRNLKSEGNFTTNPLNNKSSDYVDQKGQLARRTTGNELVKEHMQLSEEMREHVENELYSEVFAQAIHQRSFWDALAKSFEGRSMAAKMIIRMASQSEKMMKMISGLSDSHMNNRLISDIVKSWTGQDKSMVAKPIIENGKVVSAKHEKQDAIGANMNDILIDMLNDAQKSKTQRNTVERDYTNVVGEIAGRSKDAYDYTKDGLAAGYRKVIPVGSKSYKDVMTALQKFADSVVGWIADHKPAGIFADFRTNSEIVTLATKLLHAGNMERQEAMERVVKQHAGAFDGMSEAQLRNLHDTVVREKDPRKAKAALEALPEKQQAAFRDMKEEAKKIHDKLVEAGLLSRNQYRENHMGQSIKWFNDKGISLDDRPDSALRDDVSQLKYADQFLKEKSYKTTDEIADQGLKHKTINPLEMFADYVEDAHKNIALKNALKEAREKGWVLDEPTKLQKASGDFIQVSDDALKSVSAMEDKGFKIVHPDGSIFKDADGHEMTYRTESLAQKAIGDHTFEEGKEPTVQPATIDRYRTESTYSVEKHHDVGDGVTVRDGDFTRNFPSLNDAQDFISKQEKQEGVSYKTNTILKDIPVATASDLYYHKDFAHLLNVILSKDNLRQGQVFGISGDQVMKLKNTVTMLQMALSGFHYMTIAHEAFSSNMSHQAGLNKMNGDSAPVAFAKGFAASLNLGKVVHRDASDLKAFMEKTIANNDYASTPEGMAEAKRLLGVDNVNAVDIYKQFFSHGGQFHQDESLRSGIASWGKVKYGTGADTKEMSPGERAGDMYKGFVDSFHDTLEQQRLAHEDSVILPFSKAMIHHTLVGATAGLMENVIPKAKFAAFAREYALKVEAEKRLGLEPNEQRRAELARDTMKFVEDRFGEVNWKNLWMNASYKTALQFAFRSFTWVAGSWKALGKAGIDIAKLGWFTAKGEKYELTEKGYWGLSALCAHAATAGAISLVYGLGTALGGKNEQETDENTPILTRMLFPRIDPYDNTKRLSIPSYVTEGFKILSHLGIIGNKMDMAKLVSGHLSSIGNAMDIMRGEDFRGVTIRNPDDNMLVQAFDVSKHVLASAIPISFASLATNVRDNGYTPAAALSFAGITDAPASAKRSEAVNLAYEIARREYKGKEINEEDMDLKDNLKRAMKQYADGDRSKLSELMASGAVSKRQADIAMTRYPVIDNKPNPRYKDPLAQILGRLTVPGSLKVYEAMTVQEKTTHAADITKKVNNMMLRKDTPDVKKQEYRKEWNDLKAS